VRCNWLITELLALEVVVRFEPSTGSLEFESIWLGSHTVRIQVREDGVQFDQIVLSPTTYLNTAPGPASNDATIVAKP